MSQISAADTRRDIKVIGLVGVAHSFSHFFQLLLPPLFPLLKGVYGVSYTQLAMLMTVFYATSGLAQAPSGFVVDRFGARNVLMGGLTLCASAAILIGLAPHFWLMVPCVALAGLGNSVFHPAGYAILSASVTPRRLGRAYSIHTLGGNLGWTAAPLVVLTLTGFIGWRMALVTTGLLGLVVVVLIAWQSAILADDRVGRAARRGSAAAAAGGGPIRMLFTLPILLCFGYFALVTLALVGLQAFLPTTLNALYGTPLPVAGSLLTTYLLGGVLGILTGGILADRMKRHERLIGGGLLAAACFVLIVGLVPLSTPMLFVVIALAGFFASGTNPARDMLVRAATPPGATGKVFGFVYSGLDTGAALGPLVLGIFLDHGAPRLVLLTSAAALALAVSTALVVRQATPPRLAAGPAE